MDPSSGQFLTRDPLNAQTHQPYSYAAAANPLNATDPSGLACLISDGNGGCWGGDFLETMGEGVQGLEDAGVLDMSGDNLLNVAGIAVDLLLFIPTGGTVTAGVLGAGFGISGTQMARACSNDGGQAACVVSVAGTVLAAGSVGIFLGSSRLVANTGLMDDLVDAGLTGVTLEDPLLPYNWAVGASGIATSVIPMYREMPWS